MPQGNYRKATEQYIELLLEVVEKAPHEFGYEFGTLDGRRDYQRICNSRQECALSSKQSRQILQKKTTFTFGQSIA